MQIQALKEKLGDIYQTVNQRVEGRLDIVKQTFQNFSENEASRAAAGMTYYTLFSLFPLLIVIVTVGSFFVGGTAGIDRISQLMTTVIPVSSDLIQRNVQRVVDLRNSVGLIGLIGFIWSASNAFAMLTDNINRAFPESTLRSFFKKRLVAFIILGTIIVVLVGLTFSSTLFNLISELSLPILASFNFDDLSAWTLMANLLSWAIPFILFLALYHWVPNTEVEWQAALWSAMAITLLLRFTSNSFNWYLSSGLTNYELVYGSLSAIVILLFWIYINSMIIFFGANLCAAINQYLQKDVNLVVRQNYIDEHKEIG